MAQKTFNIASLVGIPAPKRTTVIFRKNEFIFAQGERNDFLFYIESGW